MERVPPSEPGVDDADDDGEEECPIRCVVLVDGGGKNQKTKCLWLVDGAGEERQGMFSLGHTIRYTEFAPSWLISDLALLNEGVSAGAAAAAMMMDPYQ